MGSVIVSRRLAAGLSTLHSPAGMGPPSRTHQGGAGLHRLTAGGNRIRTIGPAEKETAVERGPQPTIVVSRDDLCLMTPSSLWVRHLPSATAERPFARAGPLVRIRLPPTASQEQTVPALGFDGAAD
jgi:hypothetical protein